MLTVEEQLRLIADAAMDALDLDTAAERRATPRKTVLDHKPAPNTWSPVQFTEEVATMIDVKTTDPRQKRPMRIVAAGILAAAAAVVAVAFVVIRDADDVTPTDEPSPTVTVPPTLPPRALPETNLTRLLPGPYFVDHVDGIPTPRIVFTIGADLWDKSNGEEEISMGDLSFMALSHPGVVFSDACHWENGYQLGPVDTVDGLVAALREQRGWAEVTDPSDISVDGYAGKAFQRTAPADMSDCDTTFWGPHFYHAFQSWQREEGALTPITAGNFAGLFYDPGQIETLWVLDIDGTVVVINTRPRPEASAAARVELAAVLDSIRIERG
jgi:hypothetical protein